VIRGNFEDGVDLLRRPPVRKLLILGSLIACLSGASVLGAQPSAASVNTVRLRFQQVDQLALDFGVDTAAIRGQVIRRLSDAGIAIATSPHAPELRIMVRVPKSLAPVDLGILSIDMALLVSDGADTHRTIWHSSGTTVRFTTYTSLQQLVPEQLARGLDELLAAHHASWSPGPSAAVARPG
jgi:hypothetical protein